MELTCFNNFLDDFDDQNRKIFTEIRREKLNQTWTKFNLKLDPDLLTLGRSRLTIQFGQAGDEDGDDPALTSLEISLVHLESESDRASDTNLVTNKQKKLLRLVATFVFEKPNVFPDNFIPIQLKSNLIWDLKV